MAMTLVEKWVTEQECSLRYVDPGIPGVLVEDPLRAALP
jgi:hypothetical protein